jgi:DNA-binding LacI/PurR family transcriptional regulator
VPAKRATIKDVARLAGVSQSTVSNALNDRSGKMAQETADRVRSAIDVLGYVPHGAARQLRRGYANIIGVLVPSVANPFWGEFVRAVEEAAFPLDFGVLVGSSDRSRERERAYAEAMYQQGIRTVIFASSPVSLEHLAALAGRGLFIVTFDRRFHEGDFANVDCVTVDNAHGSAMATQHLLDLGHRRIGFLSGPIETESRNDRYDGYRAALAAAGVAPRRAWVWDGPGDGGRDFGDASAADLGRVGAAELLSRPEPVTAIVAVNDMYALGAYAGVRSAGLKVGSDVSIVGFDGIVLAGLVEPGLSTIRQPIRLMAKDAVNRLVGCLHPDTDAGPVVSGDFKPELVVRASTGPVPASGNARDAADYSNARDAADYSEGCDSG